jgi:hypothetical protein
MQLGMLRNRKLRCWGARWAFFAFWLQLAVSAGHMHPEDVFGPLGHPVVAGQGATLLEADWQNGNASGDPHSGAVGDICAICATMQIVAAAVPPVPFLLQAPIGPIGMVAVTDRRGLPQAALFRLFQPRAPPFVQDRS